MMTPLAAAKAYAATQKGMGVGDAIGGSGSRAQPRAAASGTS